MIRQPQDRQHGCPEAEEAGQRLISLRECKSLDGRPLPAIGTATSTAGIDLPRSGTGLLLARQVRLPIGAMQPITLMVYCAVGQGRSRQEVRLGREDKSQTWRLWVPRWLMMTTGIKRR